MFNALLPSVLETAADTAQVEHVRHKVCNIADFRTHTFVIVVASDWFVSLKSIVPYSGGPEVDMTLQKEHSQRILEF